MLWEKSLAGELPGAVHGAGPTGPARGGMSSMASVSHNRGKGVAAEHNANKRKAGLAPRIAGWEKGSI